MTDLKTFLLDYTGKIQQCLNGFFIEFPNFGTNYIFLVLRYKKKLRSIYWFQNLFYSSMLNYAHFIVSKAVDQNIC